MRHLLFYLQYRGTRYHGFQVQKNAVSVAEVIQNGVERVFEGRLDIKGCSRTDAGVHANQFALTLRTTSSIPCDRAVRALNVNLPEDVAVLSCQEVPEEFHPRYSCIGKRYLYRIWESPVKNPFLSDLAIHIPRKLDVERMNAAAQEFLGRHDFVGFCAAGGKKEDTLRDITAASVKREAEMVTFSVTGSGFLYHMVRIMMGTLLEVSSGAIAPEEIKAILESRNRNRAGPTAPPQGLYLDAVYYPDEAFYI